MAELKPCPFCGGKAEVSVNAQTLSTKVCCKHCEVVMKRCFKEEQRWPEDVRRRIVRTNIMDMVAV